MFTTLAYLDMTVRSLRAQSLLLICLLSPGVLAGQGAADSNVVRMLAFGDINLGRSVGQELVRGNLDYPFDSIRVVLQSADIVFANLESQLTDQKGETQHPKFNLIFCGPPEGAQSLKGANISVVSTSNNHAFDYGFRALKETIQSLHNEDIHAVGTSVDSVSIFQPVIVDVKGLRIAFVAYTQFVNMKRGWSGRVSLYDSTRIKKEIALARRSADIVIASYHGGGEYVDAPEKVTHAQLRFLVDAGADIVFGHHPHVPQGIELYKDKFIFLSLGNFVFFQPQRYWTQRSFGVDMELSHSSDARISSVRLIPFRAGKQPSLHLSDEEHDLLFKRLQRLSNVRLVQKDRIIYVRIPSFTTGE
jgi:poly-gamma-glutamate capsule biosynthesis protein CapA/YwtB (metallophosphatase superfamily)